MRTAKVILPAALSTLMSRRLLTTRMLTINKPMGMDIHHAAGEAANA